MIALDDAQYVLPCYAIVAAAIAGYALHLVRRGRALARRVPPERRRWSDSP